MAQVSLIATGAQLGKTSGQIHLSKLRTNGYTRTFAGTGYLRVNPFQVENGNADDPSRADAKHYLGNWLNYDHDALNTGSGLTVVSSYGDLELSWSLPAGYSRATAILDQQLYVKDTGQTSINATAQGTNPFTSPDYTDTLGDGTSASRDLSAYIGKAVAVGIKPEFDDSVTNHTVLDANAYDIDAGETPLTGTGRGLAVMIYDPTPTLTGLRQDTCESGSTVNLYVLPDMEGPSTGRLEITDDGGSSWTFVTTVSAGTNFEIGPYVYPEGVTYQMRLRYNDVSPALWDTSNTLFATCDGA